MRHILPLAVVALILASGPHAQPLGAPPNAPGLQAAAPVQDDGITWTWAPIPRWLDGVNGRAQAFSGGLDFASHFVETTADPNGIPPIRIVFDPSIETLCRTFLAYGNHPDQGPGKFLGAAYDVSNPDAPRRLNVGFQEHPSNAPDGLWNPDDSANGKGETLFVFASDYDGTGTTYQGLDLDGLDVLYGLAARRHRVYPLYFTVATLEWAPPPLRDVTFKVYRNGIIDVEWAASPVSGASEAVVIADETVLATAAPEADVLRVTGLDPSRPLTYEFQLRDAAGTVIASESAEVQPLRSTGIAAVSNLDPGRRPTGTYADGWGYTAPDGTEYALLTSRDHGLSIIDISGAPEAPPVEVAFIERPGFYDTKDVKVYGRYAYVVSERGPAVVVDLSTPSAPVIVREFSTQPAGITEQGAHNLHVAEGHLWFSGSQTAGHSGVRVFSLADPARPVFVGEFQPTHDPAIYYHDFEVRDGIGFGSAIYGGGVDVLDVSDPSDIRLISTFTYPTPGAHNTCTSEDGQTIYVGDEIGLNTWIRIFDISDLTDAELVGEIVVDPEAVVHNCAVRGDRLYVAHYSEGLRVYDISDPHAPVETAFFDTYTRDLYGYVGAFTAYPHFASGKVVVADMQTGIWVMTLGEEPVATESAPVGQTVLRVFPNPAAGRATLAYTLAAPSRAEVVVVDVLGREVARQSAPGTPGSQQATLDTSGWPAGLYIARLVADGRPHAATTLTVGR